MSAGLGAERSGALKMRLLVPPIRLPSDPKAPGIRLTCAGGTWGVTPPGRVPEGLMPRLRIRLICRSRRTITFVICTGQSPLGSTVCLHIGHNDELRRRNVSMQSGWKICRHGNSRTLVILGSKSSKQMGHVNCDQDAEFVSSPNVVGTEDRRTIGVDFCPVSVSTEGDIEASAGPGAEGADFSVTEPSTYVYIGILSRISCETVRRLTPRASRSTWPSSTRWRRLFRRLRCIMCIEMDVTLTARMRIARTMTRKTHKLGSVLPESVLTLAHNRT